MKKIISYLASGFLLYFIIKQIFKIIGGSFGIIVSLLLVVGAIFLLEKVTDNL